MGGGGARHFSSWKLNDAHNLTILGKGVGTFSSCKEGGAKQNLSPDGGSGACFYAFNCLVPNENPEALVHVVLRKALAQKFIPEDVEE